ncbi:molybdopterin molybdenumtransferase [bacterium BMS3Bbin10]|nr:molybdopterin molybdenumtransferase [bacterium BMS3Bbin10]
MWPAKRATGVTEPRKPLLAVDEARSRVLAGLEPVGIETIPLEEGHGRVLAQGVAACITQPPFDASAMDGYAVRAADLGGIPCDLSVIGDAGAGHPFEAQVGAGQAVRIFTGGAVPEGADAVVMQEDTQRDGNTVVVKVRAEPGNFIRPRGYDFAEGDTLLRAGRKLGARDLALAAAMNVTQLKVRRKPVVAILATGDELVMPGDELKPGQIVSSIPFGLAAMVEAAGGRGERIGIARDTADSLAEHIARAREADILLTIGGASVGDHDLVQGALRSAGMELDFWKIAMRPGKPLMFGTLGPQRIVGLPGNPVSALICARIFLIPMLEKLLAQDSSAAAERPGVLAEGVGENGPRQHYMRATFESGPDGAALVRPVRSQDSSLLSPLSQADCLIVRSPGAPAALAGEAVAILPLDF